MTALVPRRAELDRQHRRAPRRAMRSLLWHWFGRWFRAPRRASFAPMPRVGAGQVSLTFGGHATALIRYAELSLVVDPMLGRWCGGVRREVEPGLAPGDLDGVGVVLITHGHRDHLHLPTLRRLPRGATVVVPPGLARLVSPLGFARVIELAPGGDLEVRGVTISAWAMTHGDAPLARGNIYLLRGPGPSVVACGDGAWSPAFGEIGARHEPDIALLPIGGYLPLSFRDRHMSPLDALYAFEDLRARLLVPLHHGAFALSYERLDEPVRWLHELAEARGLEGNIRVLAPGESEVFVTPRQEAIRPSVVRIDTPAPAPAGGEATAADGDGTVKAPVNGDQARSVDILLDDRDDSAPVMLGAPPMFGAAHAV